MTANVKDNNNAKKKEITKNSLNKIKEITNLCQSIAELKGSHKVGNKLNDN